MILVKEVTIMMKAGARERTVKRKRIWRASPTCWGSPVGPIRISIWGIEEVGEAAQTNLARTKIPIPRKKKTIIDFFRERWMFLNILPIHYP